MIVHGRTLTEEVNTGASVSLIDVNFVLSSDIVPEKTVTIEGVGHRPFKVPVACLPIKCRDWEMELELGVLKCAPAPILVLGLIC